MVNHQSFINQTKESCLNPLGSASKSTLFTYYFALSDTNNITFASHIYIPSFKVTFPVFLQN